MLNQLYLDVLSRYLTQDQVITFSEGEVWEVISPPDKNQELEKPNGTFLYHL